MSEPEELPNVPQDWRDWINEFPTIKSIAIFCVIAWIVTPAVMLLTGWLIGQGYVVKDGIAAVLSLHDKWLDALNWLTTAAVFGVVIKRATTKPEVVRAEGEVKAATLVAAATAASVAAGNTAPSAAPLAPAPASPATVDAILEAEAAARREKHELAPPVLEEG